MRERSGAQRSVDAWRAQLLDRMLTAILVLGLVVGIISIVLSQALDDWLTVVVDAIALTLIAIIKFVPKMQFHTRIAVLLATSYALGVYLLFAVGLVGHAYLLAVPVMTALLLGLRPAIAALIINVATITVVGIIGATQPFGPVPQFERLHEWLVIGVNFMFLNAVTTLFTALLLGRLEQSLDAELTLNTSLETGQAELRDANTALQRSEQVRLAFLRATSHELRTPLTAIVGLAETLQRHDPQLDDTERRQLIERLAFNGERLQRLISDLLDVDRLSTDLVTADRERRNVGEVVADICREITPQAHTIDCELVDTYADIDAPKFERVVINLVANAVRHTPAGTTVAVRLFDDGDDIVLTVEDDGPGIANDYLDIIFDPFVQGPERHSAAQPGTGLGLTLVKQLVELHGGTVTVTNQADAGARFEVRLPRHAPQQEATTNSPSGELHPAT